MDITKDMIEEIFEDDAEVVAELFENSDFNNWEDFFVYSIQNYFNFLELDKDIDSEKSEILKAVFNIS